MNKAMVMLFLATIQPVYKRHLENNLVGITQQSVLNISTSLFNKYGCVTPIDREMDITRMKKQWEALEPTKILFAQINDANKYSIIAGTLLQEHNLLQAAEVLVLKNGQFSQEYKE